MARFLIVGGFLAVVFWIYAVADCFVQPPARHRGVSKGAWLAIVILIPVLGGVLWFVIGRARWGRQGRPRPMAPEDDSDYLRKLRIAESDATIERLKEELARLDEEDDEGETDKRP